MFKKLPWKNIIIVFAAMLVVPVLAFAMTTAADPKDEANDRNIKITSDESNLDAASAATSLLTSGALGYLDAATSATALNQNSQGGGSDAVSSATVNTGSTGGVGYDDDEYEEEDDEEEDDD